MSRRPRSVRRRSKAGKAPRGAARSTGRLAGSGSRSLGASRPWLRALLRAPAALQLSLAAVLILSLWFAANGIYQIVRKPTELFFPVSGVLHRTPAQTWDRYGAVFRRHSTPIMAPELLAAIAQVEGAGNPIARTYWRWSLTHKPFEIYRPASSAVGMYQITDGTFAQARKYCIRNHAVVQDGPWHDPRSCWFNALYTRTIASHAVELTSAYLHQQVTRTLVRHRLGAATLEQKQNLAAIIHLCGAGAGERYAARGLQLTAKQHCAQHDAHRYLRKVNTMKRYFALRRAAAS